MNCIGIDLGGTRIKIGLVVCDTIVARQVLPARCINGLAAHLPVMPGHGPRDYRSLPQVQR